MQNDLRGGTESTTEIQTTTRHVKLTTRYDFLILTICLTIQYNTYYWSMAARGWIKYSAMYSPSSSSYYYF